jgi:hypothetical protein
MAGRGYDLVLEQRAAIQQQRTADDMAGVVREAIRPPETVGVVAVSPAPLLN